MALVFFLEWGAAGDGGFYAGESSLHLVSVSTCRATLSHPWENRPQRAICSPIREPPNHSNRACD